MKIIRITFLLLALCACTKKDIIKYSSTSTPTNEIMKLIAGTTGSINSVCGDIDWRVNATLNYVPADAYKYWLIYVIDSLGVVVSYVRIYNGTATYTLANGQGCPSLGNCGYDYNPTIWIVGGNTKPVVGQRYTGVRLAQYWCPQCSVCQ